MLDHTHAEDGEVKLSTRTKLTLCTNAQQVASVVSAYFDEHFDQDQDAVAQKKLSTDLFRTSEQTFHTLVHDRLDEIYREQPEQFQTDIQEVEPQLQTYLRKVLFNYPYMAGSGFRRI